MPGVEAAVRNLEGISIEIVQYDCTENDYGYIQILISLWVVVIILTARGLYDILLVAHASFIHPLNCDITKGTCSI